MHQQPNEMLFRRALIYTATTGFDNSIRQECNLTNYFTLINLTRSLANTCHSEWVESFVHEQTLLWFGWQAKVSYMSRLHKFLHFRSRAFHHKHAHCVYVHGHSSVESVNLEIQTKLKIMFPVLGGCQKNGIDDLCLHIKIRTTPFCQHVTKQNINY